VKRLGDVIGLAVMVGKIAIEEIEDLTTDEGKNAAAVALGRMGRKARAEGMSAKRRKEIATKAAKKRWPIISSDPVVNVKTVPVRSPARVTC
jgi:hypothetical protein